MQSAALEHINFTVSDPDKTAALLYELFAVHVRWAGPGLQKMKAIPFM